MVLPFVPSILGPLLILIYINDITEGFLSNAKLFVDDVNKDLEKISKWVTQWKVDFNPDTTRQSQEVIFSCKLKKRFILIYCLIMPMLLGHLPKNAWELYLTLSYDHLKMVSGKICESIGLPLKLQNLLPRAALITIYKAFIRPHLDYGNILYDQVYNVSFHQKLESIRECTCLATNRDIRGT